jgi:hypothetical protein
VDLILNIRSFDEMLRQTFDQILQLIKVSTGLLIFYYHDKDEFKIFYQKNLRKKVIKRARISQDNILLRAIKGPDDVVIKGRLNASVRYEKEIIDELTRRGRWSSPSTIITCFWGSSLPATGSEGSPRENSVS